jgi:KaiC/GvpD/RAD55 family RecA-like ATPase/tetratricopeptide (TPR) repeat protein
LQNINLESLLKKAKEQEKKYQWLQAIKTYKKVLKLSSEVEKSVEKWKIHERIGYGFFRAALQAETRKQFELRMKFASKNYQQTFSILQKLGDKEASKNHAKAMVAYTNSWFEQDLSKMETLTDEWWTLEKKALEIYEKKKNIWDIGKTCNNLMEYSVDRRYFFNSKEFLKRRKELINIGEKAISNLEKTGDEYELARAYCWTAWYYQIGTTNVSRKKDDLSYEKWFSYSKKALILSQKVGDGWLIGWAYNTISSTLAFYSKNYLTLLEENENLIKHGQIIRDNYMEATGKWKKGNFINLASKIEDDPEKKRQNLTDGIKNAKEALLQARIINAPILILLSELFYSRNLIDLASQKINIFEKRQLIEEAVNIGRKGLEHTKGRTWTHIIYPMVVLSEALFLLSKIEKNDKEKKQLLLEALKVREDARSILIEYTDVIVAPFFAQGAYQIALIKSEIAKTETNMEQKIAFFNDAIKSWEECLSLVEKINQALLDNPVWIGNQGFYYNDFGTILSKFYLVSKQKSVIDKAIIVHKKAAESFNKCKLTIHVAESYWKIALNYNIIGQHLEASHHYALASKAYQITSRKIPSLEELSNDYSLYMNAWSEIEQAKHSHTIEDYEEAKQHYEKAANFHESSSSWNYLTSNYFAWAKMEEAEGYSRKENTPQAKQRFQKAFEQFCNAQESFKQKLEEITTSEEKEMTKKLFEATELRRKYCRARILMEEAKLLDREGKYLQSSRSYGRAAQEIGSIVDKMDVEAERKELEYIAILCRAWEKMANAEETTSSESYLKAAVLFEQAKNHCYTKKASLWALGNSNFCRGLAAGLQYKTSLDLADHAKAKGYIKTASNDYLQAGFKNASEYAKATQRLFDAYVIMNQAEGEINQEKRAKQYQMAENLLQIAAGSFMKAKQPEKTAQVQEILANVREEKALAISLSQVMQAPSIASTTQSFTAPTPTSETSIGLESFEHANVQANLVTHVKEVKVGESFCLSIEFVNAGREPALLMRVDDFVPSNFVVVKKPEIYRIEESCLNMKGKQLAPLKLVEVKLTLQPSKKGQYQLNPKVHYLDELGKNKSLQLKALDINVEEVLLEHRVSTGTQELDSLLLGGIPQEYSVVLTGSASDEREYLIKNFLNAGIKEDEVVFYVSIEAEGLETLLEKSNFYLFLCNPKPKTQVPDLPNAFKLRSKTDLTNLSISLAKAYRNIEPSRKKRICIEIVSDVLLDYGSRETRKWISELKTDFGSKGFTMLAVINPLMHASEELHSVLDLFDGEIELIETEDSLECKKSIRVKKLRNQDYIKNPMCLTNHT